MPLNDDRLSPDLIVEFTKLWSNMTNFERLAALDSVGDLQVDSTGQMVFYTGITTKVSDEPHGEVLVCHCSDCGTFHEETYLYAESLEDVLEVVKEFEERGTLG